jgi:hypothetical protein
MTVLTFPSINAASANWRLVSNTLRATSPLAGTVQTLELPGARWGLKMTFSGLDTDERHQMMSFLTKCRGSGGRFYYGDPFYLIEGPRGTLGGTPLVAGASQTGASLATDGWTADVTNVIRQGDYIQFDNSAGGRELHLVTADANSDGSGAATLAIEPPIRVSPADNAAITVTGAMCQMMLVDDEQAGWSSRPGRYSDFEINAIEAFTDAA